MDTKSKDVRIDNLCLSIKSKFDEMDKVFFKYANREAVITSGNDSEHSGIRYSKRLVRNNVVFDENLFRALKCLEYQISLHYFNRAIDLRINDLKLATIKLIVEDLKIIFPSPQFDVIDELDHIHLEENVLL